MRNPKIRWSKRGHDKRKRLSTYRQVVKESNKALEKIFSHWAFNNPYYQETGNARLYHLHYMKHCKLYLTPEELAELEELERA